MRPDPLDPTAIRPAWTRVPRSAGWMEDEVEPNVLELDDKDLWDYVFTYHDGKWPCIHDAPCQCWYSGGTG